MLHTYGSTDGALQDDSATDGNGAQRYLLSTGHAEMLEIRNVDGRTTAVRWHAQGRGYVAGAALDLGAYQDSDRFLIGDIDGDGKNDLLVLHKRNNQALAQVWLTQADGSLAQAGETAIGAWHDDSHYLMADGQGNGKVGLWVVENYEESSTRVSYWVSTGGGFNLLRQLVLDGWDYKQRISTVDVHGNGQQSLLIAASVYDDGDHLQRQTLLTVQPDLSLAQSTLPVGRVDRQAQQLAVLKGVPDSHGSHVLGVYSTDEWNGNGYSTRISLFDNGQAIDFVPPMDSHRRQILLTGDLLGQGHSDLVQIWENEDDQTTVTTWLREGNRYIKGADSDLGPWQYDATFRLQDIDSDGRVELISSFTGQNGEPQINSYLFDGSQFQTPYNRLHDTRLLELDLGHDGRRSLLAIEHGEGDTAVAVLWLASGSGYVKGGSQLLGDWQAGAQYLVGQMANGKRGLLVIHREDNMAVATRWSASTTGLLEQGSTTVGEWDPSVHYQYGDFRGQGLAELLAVKVPADNNSQVSATLWRDGDGMLEKGATAQIGYWGTPYKPVQIWLQDINGDGRQQWVMALYDIAGKGGGFLVVGSGRDGQLYGTNSEWYDTRGGVLGQPMPVLEAGGGSGIGIVRKVEVGEEEPGFIHIGANKGGSSFAGKVNDIWPEDRGGQFFSVDLDGNGMGDLIEVSTAVGNETVVRVW
ncbi:hypothetical protein, partial [Chitinimonas sp.]|uniref:hypothetical protein n=1 Tax=Chitinimonas sp. TaxID=1934313 RepID=UPI0035AF2709